MQAVLSVSQPGDCATCREFERLYERAYPRIYSLAYKLLGSRSDAEDATQEAFIRAWKHYANFDRVRSFETWMSRIVANLAIDHRRRKQREKVSLLDDLPPIDSEGGRVGWEIGDDSTNPEILVLGNELTDRVRKTLPDLTREFQQVIRLADFQERSYQEIAEILRIPIGTVRSRLHRARRALRTILEEPAPSP